MIDLNRRARARIVELLRCGFDRSQSQAFAALSSAAVRIYGEPNCEVHHLAYAAAEHVYKTESSITFVDCLLESAKLVEEGDWP